MGGSTPNWFIAWPVPAGPWFGALGKPPPATRLFAAQDLHLTLAFLGAVDENAAHRAFEASRDGSAPAVEATLGAVRPFGARRRPSALAAVPREGAEALSNAIGEMRDALLEAAGAAPDDRPPRPHVTLARIARRARPEERRAALAWAESLDLGAPRVRLDRLGLYTWSLDRRSALFHLVRSRELVAHPKQPD